MINSPLLTPELIMPKHNPHAHLLHPPTTTYTNTFSLFLTVPHCFQSLRGSWVQRVVEALAYYASTEIKLCFIDPGLNGASGTNQQTQITQSCRPQGEGSFCVAAEKWRQHWFVTVLPLDEHIFQHWFIFLLTFLLTALLLFSICSKEHHPHVRIT